MGTRILTWLLALLFVAAGTPKLLGLSPAAEEFAHLGYAPWFRMLIGALEIAGGVGLLIPGLAVAAALGLVGIMIGAVWTMISQGQAPIPPAVVGVLLLVLARLRWAD